MHGLVVALRRPKRPLPSAPFLPVRRSLSLGKRPRAVPPEHDGFDVPLTGIREESRYERHALPGTESARRRKATHAHLPSLPNPEHHLAREPAARVLDMHPQPVVAGHLSEFFGYLNVQPRLKRA